MKRTKNIYHYQFRKIRKSEDIAKKNNGEGEIFKEIKLLRNTRPVVANTMDGVKEDIPGHFKNIYSGLYR